MIDLDEMASEMADQNFGRAYQLGYQKALREVWELITEISQHCGTKEAHAALDQLAIHVRALIGSREIK